MKKRFTQIGLLSLVGSTLLLVGLAPIGCKSAERSEPLAGPLRLADPQTQLGQQVFATQCYQCHPGGAAGLGPALNDKPLPGFAIKTQVREGLGVMPGFSKERISDEELEGVVKYLVALRRNK